LAEESPSKVSEFAEFLGVEKVEISKLKVAPTNNRIVVPTPEEREILVNSVKAVGITEPLDVNEKYEIISGQLRFLCAKEAGISEVVVKKWRFKSPYHERIFSLLTDTARTPLTDKDKYNFVVNALKEGKTIEQIAYDLGLSPVTVRGWYNWGKSPEVIDLIEKEIGNEEAKEVLDAYYDVGIKKKESIDAILETPKYAKDPKKSMELIRSSLEIPTRELDNIKKEVSVGLDVDLSHRKELLEQETKLFNLRIPENLFLKITKTMAKEGKTDLHKLILELLEDWVKRSSMT